MISDPQGRLCGDDLGAGDHGVMTALQEWAFRHCVPLNVTIELTLACNIRCVHCYNLDRTAGSGSCADERPLTTDEILRVMTEVREAGCLFLGLTGGEVFAHPDLFAILDHARALSLAVQLLTNGTLLRPGAVARLAGYPNLLGVSVSLYGATAESHDSVTQVPGSFRRTWDGIERLLARGIAVRPKLIVMRQNAHEVAQMRAMTDARRLPTLVDVTITARHDGTAGSLASRVGREDLARLYRGPLRDLVPRRGRPVTDERWACNCARGGCAVSARGDVLPCISVPLPAGNVRSRPFAEIWRESPVFARIRGLRLADYPRCAPCPHKAWCSGNRGAAFTASGDYTGVDPFVCETAALAHRLDETGGE